MKKICPTCKGEGNIIVGEFCEDCKYKSDKTYCRMSIKMTPTKRKCAYKKP